MMCMRGRVWGILIDSIVFPVSEPHRFHRKWRLKWRWKLDPQDPQEVEAEAGAGPGAGAELELCNKTYSQTHCSFAD